MPRDGLLTENRSHWLRTSKAGGGKHTTLELQEYTPYIGAIRAVSRVKGQLRGVFKGEDHSGKHKPKEAQFGWNRAAMHPKVVVGAWLLICPEVKDITKEVYV